MTVFAAALDLGVWVDRARVRRRSQGALVEGEYQIVVTLGEWFPCRMPPRQSGESKGRDQHEISDNYEFTGRLTDFNGDDVSIEEKDQIEVELGPSFTPFGIFEVTTAWAPRNGQGEVLLWVAGLTRIVEH